MQLADYLHRIHFTGTPRADLDTLCRIHRLHLAAIPYENLDVQLGRRVGFDLEAIFAKLVRSPRGGWCYEMNGLLAWALEQIGFRLTRLAGAVLRDRAGDGTIGTHLALCVYLDAPYLVDVGFGDGIVEPARLVPGKFRQDDFEFALEQLDAQWWRFHNQPHGGAPTFDFRLAEAAPEALADRCEWLQTAPESGFVQNFVCQRYVDRELRILRGRVLRLIRGGTVEQRSVDSKAELTQTLSSYFGIELDVPSVVWERINARHEAWLQTHAQRA